MVDKTPAQITAGIPDRGSKVHATQFSNGFSRSHSEEDISRLQSAVHAFSESLDYTIGDLVLEGGIQYRAIANISASSFDGLEWIVSDGVGVKNVVQVFSEGDFPAIKSITGFPSPVHQLDNNTEYILSGPITLENSLFVEAGHEICIRAIAKEVNSISTVEAITLFSSRAFSGTYDGVLNSGGNQITFFTGNTTGILEGQSINIRTNNDSDYSQFDSLVNNVVLNTSFRISSKVVFNTDISDGDWDVKAKIVEMENLAFKNDDGNAVWVDLNFTPFGTSEFYCFHCEIEGFSTTGSIVGAVVNIFANNEIEKAKGQIEFDDCIFAFLYGNTWLETDANTPRLLVVGGPETISVNVVNNSFLSTLGNPLVIIGSNFNSITNGRVVIEENYDRNLSSTSLFNTSLDGVTETDPRLIVKSNPRQSDSITGYGLNLPSTQVVTIGDNALTEVTSANWAFDTDSQRFSIDGNGLVTHDGLDVVHVLISYTVTMSPVSGTKDLFAGILINGSPFFPTSVTSVVSTESITLSGSGFKEISSNDTIALGVGNSTDIIDINVLGANVSAIRIT